MAMCLNERKFVNVFNVNHLNGFLRMSIPSSLFPARVYILAKYLFFFVFSQFDLVYLNIDSK